MGPQCAICLEVFLGSDVVQATKCGHTFHGRCIQQWLEGSSRQCPQCHLNTDQSELIRIYFNMASATNFEQIIDKLRKEAVESKQVIDRLRKEAVERDKLIAKQTAESQQTIKSLKEELDAQNSTILQQQLQIEQAKQDAVELARSSLHEMHQRIVQGVNEYVKEERKKVELDRQQFENTLKAHRQATKEFSKSLSTLFSLHGFRFPIYEPESESESKD